jgi:hypothetical protein
MNKIFRFSDIPFTALPLLLILFYSCGNRQGTPDVSGIAVSEVHIERFDRAFFSLDSNKIQTGLYQLNQQYPWFTNDFVANILGAGPLSDTSQLAFQAARQFLVSYLPVRDSLEKKYTKLESLEKELTREFRFVKYYFPQYKLPQKVVTFIGPFDGPGVAITPYALAIGLQSYAGKNSSFYQEGKGLDMFPPYISRRFEPEYITANCVRAIAEDIYPDSSDNKPMIDQMIVKGRYWWLQAKLMPDSPDSIMTGYSEQQLKWAASNEAGVWNFFLQNTDLYTVDPDIIKNYIGEGPRTLGMPDASPGNIGAWLGWQIVKKYVDGHGSITPEQLMRTPARQIFEESKYKPK